MFGFEQQEDAKRARQITLPGAIDLGDQLVDRQLAPTRRKFQRIPKRALQRNAGLVSGDHDRTLGKLGQLRIDFVTSYYLVLA